MGCQALVDDSEKRGDAGRMFECSGAKKRGAHGKEKRVSCETSGSQMVTKFCIGIDITKAFAFGFSKGHLDKLS